MNTNPGGTPNRASGPDALERAMMIAMENERKRNRVLLGEWLGVGAVALVALGLGLAGCGGQGSSSVASDTSVSSAATQQAVVASNEYGPTPIGGESLSRPVEISSDLQALPPDVVPAVSDTFVTAGQGVEVTVEGTSDVTEMSLSDGHGDAIPMVRDSTGNTWRVGYRVPLKPKQDRIGLAVTAKNEQHRWRRVWLFLKVDDGQHPVETTEEK